MQKKVTIKDVASIAGASVGTISKVLNGRRCAPKLQKQVEDAIRKLNYVPNVHARSVRATRSNCIGIIVDKRWENNCPCLQTWILGLLNSFSSSRYGGNIYFIDSHNPELSPKDLPQNVDGLVLLGHFSQHFFDLLQNFLFVPAITYWEKMTYSRGISLEVDLHSGMQQLAEHLFALGHRHIGLISNASELGVLKNNAFLESIRPFYPDFNEALSMANPQTGKFYEFGYKQTMLLLEQHPECTAVVYMADCLAMGGLGALAQKQLRIPQDISVASFDNSFWAQSVLPLLTEIGFDYDVLTSEMINYLLAVIEDESERVSVQMRKPRPLEFFRRQSTGWCRDRK